MSSTTTTTTTSSSSNIQRRKTATQVAAATTADVTRRMVCGGLAGMIAKTVTNPLERIKMLYQTGEHGGSSNTTKSNYNINSWQIFKNIIKHEGIIGLWAGNGANLLRIFPSKAVIFSSNDFYKSILYQLLVNDNNSIHNTNSKSNNTNPYHAQVSFIAGGLAGMTATAVTYPLDFARGRIAGKLGSTKNTNVNAPKKVYTGIIQTIIITVKDEGILALYKGITPTLVGAMPYTGIQFGTVGLLERFFPLDNNNNSSSPIRKMIFGGLGGVMAGLITYPNDTVRRMLQLQGSRGSSANSIQFAGYWHCVSYIYEQYGIVRFYRGLTINLIRMAPNTAVQFGSYELLKNITSTWTLFDS